MSTYIQDVLSQPDSLRKCIAGLSKPDTISLLEALGGRTYGKVVFAGMGSSNYCSYGAGILLSNHGICNIRISAGELLHYEMPLLDSSTLLVLISQSGESAEIVKIIDKLSLGCTVAAITNDPDSILARRADFAFMMGVEEEESVTTRTYVASIMISAAIASAVCGNDVNGFIHELSSAVNEMDKALENHRAITDTIKNALGFPPYICLLGRGESLSTVEAGTLFMREIVKYPAFGLDSGEFRHGPMEIVDENFHGIIIAPHGASFELQCKLAGDIVEKGGKVVFVGTGENIGVPRNVTTILLPHVPEILSPLLTILPIQLYANLLAEKKGVVPGKFRWGSKIMRAE